MVDLILGPILPYILGAIAILGGLWGYGKKRERDGRKQEQLDRRLRDVKEAAAIKEKLDANARDGNALERLRSRGRLRDADKE